MKDDSNVKSACCQMKQCCIVMRLCKYLQNEIYSTSALLSTLGESWYD